MSDNRRLLFSLAHPDDETFGSAGTLARYADEGAEVHLICATDGDVGTISDEFMQDFDTVAERRMHELNCAAEVLGFTVHALGYRDSGMQGTPDNQHPRALASQDVTEVARRVTRVIRQSRPQVVVTFDPTGGYFHPDHIAIHHATTQACEAAGDPSQFPEQIEEEGLRPYKPQKLYYAVFDMRIVRMLMPLAPLFGIDPERMGRNEDMNFKAVVDAQVSEVHTVIRVRKYRELIERAWACHASQQDMGDRGLLSWLVSRLMGGDDTYQRVLPPVNGRLRERDLFAGVVLGETG